MQTAIEFLIENLGEYFPHEIGGINYLVKQAKQLEKQQIEEAFYCGNQIFGNWDADSTIYYNETYGSKGSDETKTDNL